MKAVSKGVVLQVAARKENTGHHRAAQASRNGCEESCSLKGPRKADFEHWVACCTVRESSATGFLGPMCSAKGKLWSAQDSRKAAKGLAKDMKYGMVEPRF